MPSQDDYMDSLLKNQDSDSTDTDNIDEYESFAGDPEDDDALIENALSKLKEEPDSDDDLNLEDLDLDEIYSDIGILSDGKGEMEADTKASSAKKDAVPDLEALSSMSEDEIERLLSAGAEEDSAPLDNESLPDDEELLDMLNGADDDDLQDIQEMLHRAENNEAVDESLLQRDSDKESESGELPGGENDLQNTLSEKEQRAQQKKLRKQEKAEAKAAAKAAKAAAKAEKAAAKAAAKAAKKAGTAVAAGVPEGSQGENAAAKSEKKGSPNTLFDTSLLDSIVAGAGQAGSDGKAGPAPEEHGDIDPGEDAGGASAALNEDDSGSSDFAASDTEKADEAIQEHDTPEPQKGGFLGKVLDFLTEDDEEGEESEGLQLSEENQDILNDLDNEESGSKNKKKKGASDAKGKAKKSKPKKQAPKKPKATKKPKKPKPEKPKKEKVPEPEPLIPERKLTLKRVLPVILVSVSLCVFIILLTNVSVDFADKQAAAEAYNAGDYQTCFQNLYGKNLNETEQFMFGKSESILYIRLWLREYEMFAEEGSEVEALDSLIQTVSGYPQLYSYAVQWDAGAEVAAGYQTVLSILSEKYGLTEEQAKQIAAERSDRKYTRMIVEIILGKDFNSLNGQTSDSGPEQQGSDSGLEQQAPDSGLEQDDLQDVLPEEEGLGEGEFIGN